MRNRIYFYKSSFEQFLLVHWKSSWKSQVLSSNISFILPKINCIGELEYFSGKKDN